MSKSVPLSYMISADVMCVKKKAKVQSKQSDRILKQKDIFTTDMSVIGYIAVNPEMFQGHVVNINQSKLEKCKWTECFRVFFA